MAEPIYFDHSATTPMLPEVREAMLPWLDGRFGNPGSLHRYGRAARDAIETARAQVAALIEAPPESIVFTGSGTEANNLVIHGVLGGGGHGLAGATEHHAVLEPVRALEVQGRASVDYIGVKEDGTIALDELESGIGSDTRLVSVMAVNNETGVASDVEAIASICGKRGVLYHCDAVQAVPYLSLRADSIPFDFLVFSAHKLNGPKGAAACYVRPGLRIAPLVHGGGQERGMRGGTENVPAIVGFGAACERLRGEYDGRHRYVAELRNQLEAGLAASIPGCWINGAGARRAPHIVNVGVSGMDGEMLLYALDAEGIAVSKGAACASGSPAPSHVLLAMGQDYPTAQAAIRISLGMSNTAAEVARFIDVFSAITGRLR